MDESLRLARDNIVDLYVSTRKKYILQMDNGAYAHSENFNYNKILTDEILLEHLNGDKTVGIFSANGYSKFITFDVDCANYSEGFRREVVLMIKESLISIGVPKECIYTNLSGNKGYHISIFLTDMTSANNIEKFYKYVLDSTGLSDTMVELRPLYSVGLKLPLGIHRKTNNMCWFVDNEFNNIENFSVLSEVNKLNRDEFQEIVNNITPIKEIKDALKIVISEFSNDKMPMMKLEKVFELERVGLTELSTRNYSSVQLAILYNTIGKSESEALELLNEWISRQSTRFYKTPLQSCYKENRSTIKWVYSKNIRFYTVENKSIKLSAKDIKYVSSIKDRKARHIYFAMLCHFKRYNDGLMTKFYMTYSQIAFHTGIKNYKTIKDALVYLESEGMIDIVSGFKYNREQMKYDTNEYSIKFYDANECISKYTIKDYTISYMSDRELLNDLYVI